MVRSLIDIVKLASVFRLLTVDTTSYSCCDASPSDAFAGNVDGGPFPSRLSAAALDSALALIFDDRVL